MSKHLPLLLNTQAMQRRMWDNSHMLTYGALRNTNSVLPAWKDKNGLADLHYSYLLLTFLWSFIQLLVRNFIFGTATGISLKGFGVFPWQFFNMLFMEWHQISLSIKWTEFEQKVPLIPTCFWFVVLLQSLYSPVAIQVWQSPGMKRTCWGFFSFFLILLSLELKPAMT